MTLKKREFTPESGSVDTYESLWIWNKWKLSVFSLNFKNMFSSLNVSVFYLQAS